MAISNKGLLLAWFMQVFFARVATARSAGGLA